MTSFQSHGHAKKVSILKKKDFLLLAPLDEKTASYLAVEIPGLQMADERIDNRNKTSLSIMIFWSPNNPWKALMSTDLKTRKRLSFYPRECRLQTTLFCTHRLHKRFLQLRFNVIKTSDDLLLKCKFSHWTH